jgi:hypothetical protein
MAFPNCAHQHKCPSDGDIRARSLLHHALGLWPMIIAPGCHLRRLILSSLKSENFSCVSVQHANELFSGTAATTPYKGRDSITGSLGPLRVGGRERQQEADGRSARCTLACNTHTVLCTTADAERNDAQGQARHFTYSWGQARHITCSRGQARHRTCSRGQSCSMLRGILSKICIYSK